MNSSSVYIEISPTSLHVLKGEEGLELPLERGLDGRFTEACRGNVLSALQGFLQKKNRQGHTNAFCAIGARGVSLRRLTIPASTAKSEFQNVLRLQIEAEFPLLPEELAWGYQLLGSTEASQEVVVVAIKKEVLQEYADLLSTLGATPVFTISALARGCAVPQPPQSYSVLEIGRCQSELVTFEQGVPVSMRVLPWGGEHITQTIVKKLNVSPQQAEKLKIDLDTAAPDNHPGLNSAIGNALEMLAEGLDSQTVGKTLYLSGKSARFKNIATRLAPLLHNDVQCKRLEPLAGPARSTAVLGLKEWQEKSLTPGPIILQLQETKASKITAQSSLRKWAILAAVLVCSLLALPYLEALTLKPRLLKQLSALKMETNRLAIIDREVSFLQNLKKSQPPFVDVLYVIANAAPGGTRLDAISTSRRGELSLRCSLRDGTQVTEFRTKLLNSGIFTSLVVEEQTPTADRQKVNVRMTAQWKPETTREVLAAADEKAKAADKESKTNAVALTSTNSAPKPPETASRKSTKEKL